MVPLGMTHSVTHSEAKMDLHHAGASDIRSLMARIDSAKRLANTITRTSESLSMFPPEVTAPSLLWSRGSCPGLASRQPPEARDSFGRVRVHIPSLP